MLQNIIYNMPQLTMNYGCKGSYFHHDVWILVDSLRT